MNTSSTYNVFVENESRGVFLFQRYDIEIKNCDFLYNITELRFIDKNMSKYIEQYQSKLDEDEFIFYPIDGLRDVWCGSVHSPNYEMFVFNIFKIKKEMCSYFFYYKNSSYFWQVNINDNKIYQLRKKIYSYLLKYKYINREFDIYSINLEFEKITGIKDTLFCELCVQGESFKIYKMLEKR